MKIIIVIILALFSSCSTYRMELSKTVGRDQQYLIYKYGHPDSTYTITTGTVLLFTSKKYGTFGNPIIQDRYFFIKGDTVKNWYFVQWGEDYQDRRIIYN